MSRIENTNGVLLKRVVDKAVDLERALQQKIGELEFLHGDRPTTVVAEVLMGGAACVFGAASAGALGVWCSADGHPGHHYDKLLHSAPPDNLPSVGCIRKVVIRVDVKSLETSLVCWEGGWFLQRDIVQLAKQQPRPHPLPPAAALVAARACSAAPRVPPCYR